jgi:hypothetical protein
MKKIINIILSVIIILGLMGGFMFYPQQMGMGIVGIIFLAVPFAGGYCIYLLLEDLW